MSNSTDMVRKVRDYEDGLFLKMTFKNMKLLYVRKRNQWILWFITALRKKKEFTMEEIKKNYWGITWERRRKTSWVEILLLFATFFFLFLLKECHPCHRFPSILEQYLVIWRKACGFQSLKKHHIFSKDTIQGLLLFHPQLFQCAYFL